MKEWAKFYLLILVIAAFGLLLRLPELDQRPMHTDEAVQAVKLGRLLQEGSYKYDPFDYHGPALNYFTLIAVKLFSVNKFADLNEITLRIVPVFFAGFLILLHLLLRGGLSKKTLIYSAILIAVSPAFVFYSRYYIHEILLVCFTFGFISCGYRYFKNFHFKWAFLAGLFLGLMHATKETCIIAIAACLLASCFIVLLQFFYGFNFSYILRKIRISHFLVFILTAVFVSVLFYSSFFTNFHGVSDSVRTFTIYFNRGTNGNLHNHSWHYYFDVLLSGSWAWANVLIFIFAVIGFTAALKRNANTINKSLLPVFIAFYTVVLTIIYCAIGYKTPWCMLSFLHGFILLAGIGICRIQKLLPQMKWRLAANLLFLAASAGLACQSYIYSYKYCSAPDNPYTYSQPGEDVIAISEKIKELTKSFPDKKDMRIEVIVPLHDYWPLPWYLRSFPNVAWRSSVVNDRHIASVIITAPEFEKDLAERFYKYKGNSDQLYVPLFRNQLQLRPQVPLSCFVVKDLKDNLQENKTVPLLVKALSK